jgi:hypothetical protein
MLFWCEQAEGKQRFFAVVVDPASHVRRVFGKQNSGCVVMMCTPELT